VQAALVVALLATAACDHKFASPPRDILAQRVANLHAFTRLYGVVRWFHPSDAAAAIDWDRFGIEGAHRIVNAPDQAALRGTLTELFAPIAPTVHVGETRQLIAGDPALHTMETAGSEVVAWQHKGYGDSTIATGYVSKRLHRPRAMPVPGALFAAVSQSIDATPYRGRVLRLRGKLRTARHARGQLWLRVDRADARGFFDNMARHPIVSATWAPAEIVGTVSEEATRIAFGAVMTSAGTTWYDDLELSVATTDGSWQQIEIPDGGFEGLDPLASWPAGTGRQAQNRSTDGWSITIDHEFPATGHSSLRIEQATTLITGELFDSAPHPGEVVDIDLGSGLHARVPIALYSRDGHTIGDDPVRAVRTQDADGETSPSFDAVAGVADIIVFWNVFEHFWPYWDVVSDDWGAALDAALADALNNKNVDDHVATLERLSASAPDGHVRIGCPGETQRGYLPFVTDLVEGQVVVTTSLAPAVQRGDILLTIDGHAATGLLEVEDGLISGSPRWRTARGLQRLGRGPIGSGAILHLRRESSELTVTVVRLDQETTEPHPYSAIERLPDAIYYIDLSRATMADIDAEMDRIATAPGVVFDLRGGSNLNRDALSHLLTHRDDLRGWESIPLIIRPDSAAMPAGWEDTSTWNMPQLSVLQPHIKGRAAFLTGPLAISAAESYLALVEHYHLGEIVGSATAGANGDVAKLGMPSGCSTWFTGRRVTKPDGSLHHLLGISPTIPASRTLIGVRSGLDEVLEKALAYVRTGSK
jgi:hypothetical protein